MGLIKAAVEAAGSTLHDQWKDFIRCEDLGNDILMKRVSTPNGIVLHMEEELVRNKLYSLSMLKKLLIISLVLQHQFHSKIGHIQFQIK